MKKNIIAAASLAVAALAALSCSKEADVKISPAANGVTIQVVAGDDATKTYVVDGDVPTVEWSSTDYVSVFEVVDGAVKVSPSPIMPLSTMERPVLKPL